MVSNWKTHRHLLIAYLRPQWRGVLILSLLLLGTIALQLVAPQVVRYFIDRVQSPSPGPLANIALLFLAAARVRATGRGR